MTGVQTCALPILSVESKKIKINATSKAVANKKLEGISNPRLLASLKIGSGKITAADEISETNNHKIAYFSFSLPLLIEKRTKPIMKIAIIKPTIELFI